MAHSQSTATVDFDLHSLGWKAFQDLCATVLTDVLGQTIARFFDSRDGGRDGAFSGVWSRKGTEKFDGPFTIQCKFTAQRDKQLSSLDLSDEYTKAGRLAQRGLARTYILLTNARLTGVADEKIRDILLAIPGIEHVAILGHEWLCATIRDSSRLRMLVPRVYGLGDLSQILDERAYAQSAEILSFLGDDLAKFVITQAYRDSAKALVQHGFVILLGEPACGKSTIAAALAMAALDEWGCGTIKARDADDFVRHSNPHEPKQFFWIDDAFGATQFDYSTAAAWNRVFPHMQAAMRRGARVLFTSRDYVYRAANKHLKVSSFPVLAESQVIVQVEHLSRQEREQILYNHIRLGHQPAVFRSRIKPYLKKVAGHPAFKPEIARRLSDPLFTKQLVVSDDSLDDFVAKPLTHLMEVIRTLDSGGRAALGVVFMRNGALASPLSLSADEQRAAELIGGTLASIRESLDALHGSLVLLVHDNGAALWRFKHPTVRDAFASIVAADPELLDIYLAGALPDRLLDEVSCGGFGIGGVKVIVPGDRYETVINRFAQLDLMNDAVRSRLLWFLSRRCDRVFLERYLQHNPSFINQLRVTSYLSVVADIGLIVCLHFHGLLPEEKRRSVVASLADLAVHTPDAGFLHDDYRRLFTDNEFEDTLKRVRTELIPGLDIMIDNWRDNYGYNDESDPGGYFDPLVDALRNYLEEFSGNQDCVCCIDNALERIDRVVEELQSDCQEQESDDFYNGDGRPSAVSDVRSIFDDVDA